MYVYIVIVEHEIIAVCDTEDLANDFIEYIPNSLCDVKCRAVMNRETMDAWRVKYDA
jgi:hypothetical protein